MYPTPKFLYQFETLQVLSPYLSHDVASGSDIKPCNKIDKPLEQIYRFSGNVMTSITTLRT